MKVILMTFVTYTGIINVNVNIFSYIYSSVFLYMIFYDNMFFIQYLFTYTLL